MKVETRPVYRVSFITRVFALLNFMLLLSGCGPSHDEVARVIFPSGQVDAVLVETNGGATTSFGYIVYLKEKSNWGSEEKRVAHLYGTTRSFDAYGVNLKWVDETSLRIEYYRTDRIIKFSSSTQIGKTNFNIELISDIFDKNAPSGGMLYNKLGRPEVSQL